MKQGKLPENVLKRSVFKQLHTKRKDVLLSAGVGEDCAAFTLKEDEVAVLSTDPVIWENSLDGRYAVHANLCFDSRILGVTYGVSGSPNERSSYRQPFVRIHHQVADYIFLTVFVFGV